MTGWFKTHRKMKTSPIFSDPYLFKLWMLCLMKATHTEHEQLVGNQTIKLEPGQFVTGRITLTNEYNYGATGKNCMKEITIWRWLKSLEKMEMLNIKSTNKYSVVTIVNWNQHQTDEQQMNNKRTTNEQQMNTNKNVKKEKNEKKKDKALSELPFERIVDYLNRKAKKNFRHETKETRKLIADRFEDGFIAEDFKKVIDVKTAEWKGTEHDKFLRPSTLFGNKFESYKNQKIETLGVKKVEDRPKQQAYRPDSVDLGGEYFEPAAK